MEEKKFSIYDTMRELFVISDKETAELIAKNFPETNPNKRRRLVAMLKAVAPYCDMFSTASDEKLKRKAGMVFLSKLDYSKFASTDWVESIDDTYSRISTLFKQTTAKGINPYKILYCQVLLDGNLGLDGDSFGKTYLNYRSFEYIYDSIKRTLDLTDQRTVAMFDKCSTLIAKVSADRIPAIYNTLSSLRVYCPDKNINYIALKNRKYTPDEVADILENNPSLFTATPERVVAAFKYVYAKAHKISEPRGTLTKSESTLTLLRKWVKNNSSLLSVNADTMRRKEQYLYDTLKYYTNTDYAQEFVKLFNDPVNISTINSIPMSNITSNAAKNICCLERYAGAEQVRAYIAQNPYIVGMDSKKFVQLLEKIDVLNVEKPEEKYFDKFFKFGKSLFASNLDFSVDAMIERLKKQDVISELDVDNMKNEETISKFIELFLPNNKALESELFTLIEEKQARMQRGEKRLRRDIRKTGDAIRYLKAFLKDDQTPMTVKRDRVFVLAQDVHDLHERRLALANHTEISLTESSEIKHGVMIENALKMLRDAYEQKRFNLSKKWLGIDQLYEKMMDYLDECFDDKEAIVTLFRKEVHDTFVDVIKDVYTVSENPQQTLCGDSLIVEVPGNMTKPMKELHKEIGAHETDLTQFVDMSFKKM